MRPRKVTVMTFLALGLLARVLYRLYRTRSSAQRAAIDPMLAPDPRDPVQGLGDPTAREVGPLDVDAQAVSQVEIDDAEAALDLAALGPELEVELGDADLIDAAPADALGRRDAAIDVDQVGPRDAGELYGVHTPRAVDRQHPDDDRAFDDGQNWLEALETSAVETGAEPERTLDIIDDEDVLRGPHPSATRDIPIADLGSGGRRGI